MICNTFSSLKLRNLERMMKIIFITYLSFLFCNSATAKEVSSKNDAPQFHFGYVDREHSPKEIFAHLGAIYAASWALYPLTQPKTFRENGSWRNYRNNFGKISFDHDGPIWNWAIHPMSGAELFLFYRANGYNRMNSLGMAFISSALFEFTIEIYTEVASIQDLYQTPILGSLIGVGIENVSMYLLNSGNGLGKVIGHILNPATLFWFYEGKIRITPTVDPSNKNKSAGFFLRGEF